METILRDDLVIAMCDCPGMSKSLQNAMGVEKLYYKGDTFRVMTTPIEFSKDGPEKRFGVFHPILNREIYVMYKNFENLSEYRDKILSEIIDSEI